MKNFFLNVKKVRTRRILFTLCATLCSLSLSAQSKTIKGKVVDMTGESVIGVNILEKGTTNGVITDLDGNFTLQVSPNTTLLFTYVGYLSQEI